MMMMMMIRFGLYTNFTNSLVDFANLDSWLSIDSSFS